MSVSEATAGADTAFEQGSFDWAEFTEIHEPAPPAAFNQPTDVPENPFRQGHLLMAIDSSIPDCNVLAKVDRIYKCWVRVHFFELGIHKTQWMMCDSQQLMPFDETTLHRHPDNSKVPSAFYSWIARTLDGQSENLAEKSLFRPLSPRCRPKKNLFKVGSVLALFDELSFDACASPAIVVGISGENVRLRLADRLWSPMNELLLPYHNRRLFPIEFMLSVAFPPNCHRQKELMSPSACMVQRPRLKGREDDSCRPIGRSVCEGSSRRQRVSLFNISPASSPDDEFSDMESEIFDASLETVQESDEPMEEEPRRLGVASLLPSEFSPFNLPILSNHEGQEWSPERRERLIAGAAQRLAAAVDSMGVARRLMNFHFRKKLPHLNKGVDQFKDHLCTVQVECSEAAGQFLDVSKIRQMPFYFASKNHFQVQVQRVAQFLVYCGHSQTQVMEAIASVDGPTPNGLEIYIRSEELQIHRIPKPRNFNMARYWVHTVLRALEASEKLIELVKSDDLFKDARSGNRSNG